MIKGKKATQVRNSGISKRVQAKCSNAYPPYSCRRHELCVQCVHFFLACLSFSLKLGKGLSCRLPGCCIVLFAQAPWSVSSHSVLFYENTRLAESTDNTLTVSNWKENPWAVAEVPATVKSLRKEALNDSGASTCPAWPQWWLIDQAGRNCWPVRWYDWNTLNRLQLWPRRNHDLKWILTERQSWHRPSKQQRWILGLSPRRLRINLAPKELTTPKPWIDTWIDTWILPSCLQLDTICSRSLWLPPPLRKGASTGYHSALTQCLERKWKWSPRLGDTQSLGTHDVCFLRHPESTGKEVRLCQIMSDSGLVQGF